MFKGPKTVENRHAAGRVAASINFRSGAVITATDGTVIAPSAASPGVTAAQPNQAGLAFGGTAVSSAVCNGVSTATPSAVGSPGL